MAVHLLLQRDISIGAKSPRVSIGNYERTRGVYLIGGPPIAPHLPKDIYFVARDGETPGLSDFIPGIGFMLASSRMRSVLQDFGVEAEYIDVPLRYRGRTSGNYSLVNLTRRIRGVNMNESRIELDEVGIALSAEALALDESKFQGIAMAVLAETGSVVIESAVSQALASAGCSGFRAMLPSEFRL
jgi:hypothetical protein